MKTYLFFLNILFTITNSFSQDLSNKVTGSWKFKEYVGKKQVIECPEMLVFEKGGYSILNDCYGKDIEHPVIEKGKWTFDTKKNTITLTQRKFISNYNFHGITKTLTLYIKEINGKTMKVSFNSMNSPIVIFEKK